MPLYLCHLRLHETQILACAFCPQEAFDYRLLGAPRNRNTNPLRKASRVLTGSEPAPQIKSSTAPSEPKCQQKYILSASAREAKNYYRGDKWSDTPQGVGVDCGKTQQASPYRFHSSAFALLAHKSSQFQEAVDHQTKPEIDQSSEVELEWVMLGRWGQIGIEGEIQTIAKQNGNQVFEPFHC